MASEKLASVRQSAQQRIQQLRRCDKLRFAQRRGFAEKNKKKRLAGGALWREYRTDQKFAPTLTPTLMTCVPNSPSTPKTKKSPLSSTPTKPREL